MQKEIFGGLSNGEVADLYTLTNANGLKVKITTYGATIVGVESPDRNGKMANLTLFLDTFDEYAQGHPFFGSTVGRYANRIAKGKFALDGRQYILAANDRGNHLHGGLQGFDKKIWLAEPVQSADAAGVNFSLVSPDGEEGYPGTLSVQATYSLTNRNELKMEYSAVTDAPTVVNLTNHCYWNLAGAGSGDALDHVVAIYADSYLPVDETLIPLGNIAPVKGTPMDFATAPMTIGARIARLQGGYDHCYVLNEKSGETLSVAAKIVEPHSGRVMKIFTDQPGIQFYTGNFLDGSISGGGKKYVKNAAFCLETQRFPDSPNQPQFPSTVLRPGETYTHRTVHQFSVR
ncbi:MAG: galactose mutarotase [Pirellulales bacterium]|nr:galactose mutarotase [Pirellulales bacterium]